MIVTPVRSVPPIVDVEVEDQDEQSLGSSSLEEDHVGSLGTSNSSQITSVEHGETSVLERNDDGAIPKGMMMGGKLGGEPP